MRIQVLGLCLGLGAAGCGAHHSVATDAGPGGDAGIGITGGTVPSLYFAVVGDTRPNNQDDVQNYPTAIIQKIYADIEAMNPRPQFVLSTGDYQYATTTGAQQLALYMSAASQFTGGPIFPVMGNHECTGYTDGNCVGTTVTKNEEAFNQQMLAPIGQSLPYYTVHFNAEDGSWNAKLVVIACNAWDGTQKSWLQNELSQSTTFTFIARHEEIGAGSSPPCLGDVDPMFKQYPYNILLVGHSHYFQYIGFEREVIVGNGGAPLDSNSATYGYATVQQQSNQFVVTEYDYQTAAPLQTIPIAF
jgi:hypothetical protein